MDFVFQVQGLPSWKQAVQTNEFQMLPGGKGLNQSVAAARLGADVALITVIGDDHFGEILVAFLNDESINPDLVRQVRGASTPVTSVFVNFSGETAFIGWLNRNNIVVRASEIRKARKSISDADILLITLDISISMEVLEEAINVAKASNTLIVMNPAPPPEQPNPISHLILQKVDWLVPNCWEAGMILQKHTENLSPNDLAFQLANLGVRNVCVTTSDQGCVVVRSGTITKFPAFSCTSVDTTGGSDAFCASLAISLAEKRDPEDDDLSAIFNRANAAGAIAVGSKGGACSMPKLQELEQFLRARQRPSTFH